jgi:hypothetical protein
MRFPTAPDASKSRIRVLRLAVQVDSDAGSPSPAIRNRRYPLRPSLAPSRYRLVDGCAFAGDGDGAASNWRAYARGGCGGSAFFAGDGRFARTRKDMHGALNHRLRHTCQFTQKCAANLVVCESYPAQVLVELGKRCESFKFDEGGRGLSRQREKLKRDGDVKLCESGGRTWSAK